MCKKFALVSLAVMLSFCMSFLSVYAFDDEMLQPSGSVTVSEENSNSRQNTPLPSSENLFSLEDMKVGEVRSYGTLGDGTEIYIKLVSSTTNDRARSFEVSEKTFILQYKTLLGKLKDAVKVELTCNWYKDGYDSYINSLDGVYTELDSSFSCSWADTSYAPKYCVLDLDITHNGKTSKRGYSALCNSIADNPHIVFDSYAY